MAERLVPQQAPPLGTTLRDSHSYLLRRFLGAGSMGAVYEAEALDSAGERVAIKVLLGLAGEAKGGALVERFKREVGIIAMLDSPHVVRILEAGTDVHLGIPFMVMPLMVGLDLRDLSIRRGPIQPTVAVRLIRQICFALAQAHELSIIHRDIKPANIFLDHHRSGEITARVLDFGIAKLSTDEAALTTTDSLLGTPLFMSPEQLQDTKSLDSRTDVWSLGATLYQTLAGTSPFAGKRNLPEICRAICTQPIVHLQDVAPWIEPELVRVVCTTLIRDRDSRCPSVAELAAALEPFNGGTDTVQVTMLEPVSEELKAQRAVRLAELPTAWSTPRRDAPAARSYTLPPITLSMADPLIGHALADQYLLLRRLGEGGMGAVYEALGPDGQRYAVKVIGPEHGSRNATLRRRFLREAKAIASIRSDHVVRIHMAGTDESQDLPFLVMDMLQGIDLGVLIQRQGQLHPASVARLFTQACRGLSAAHDKGIIHRDIKPANLLLHQLPSGEVVVRICDFGIAKRLTADDHEQTTMSLTRTGVMMGSPSFMSPEQCKSPRDVDFRTDIWSMGVSMYQALSGVSPWQGRKTVGELCVAICTERVVHIQDRAPWIPQGLAEVVHKALCRSPDDRFQTAEELGQALYPFTEGRLRVTVEELLSVSQQIRQEVAARAAVEPPAGAVENGSSPARAGPSGALSEPPHTGIERLHVVAGRYEIRGLLGAGGMGSVYRAWDRELQEVVALKVLRRELLGSSEMIDRFRREVKLARRVTHTCVARTFDIGQHEGERFLTMELLEGESLAALLQRQRPLAVKGAVEIITRMCDGLTAAHQAGVVHLDLKPSNVMIEPSGRIVITDFGIARALSEDGRQAADMETAFVGTPAYMAPEQVEGLGVDARADIYALGAMLYEMLTGSPPWTGRTLFAIAALRLHEPPPDPCTRRPGLPQLLGEIVTRCMARQAGDRFASTGEVAAALRSAAFEPSAEEIPLVTASTGLSFPPPPSSDSEHGPAPRAVHKTVAVLPFKNRGKPEDDYLAEGLTEDLIDTLCMISGLMLRPYSVVSRYRDADARAAGRELGVQVVVEGSVRLWGEEVRITARLLTTGDGFQLWAQRFQRKVADLLEVSDEVAGAVAEGLTVRLGSAPRKAADDPRAVDLYLQGRAALRDLWPESTRQAVDLLRRACELSPEDPKFLCAYARACTRMSYWTGSPKDEAAAREAAGRALAAAPDSAEAQLAQASVSFMTNDYATALRLLRAALYRSPALTEARVLLGRIYLDVGRPADGVAQLEAAAKLDPQAGFGHEIIRGYALLGQWQRVEELLTPPPPDEPETFGMYVMTCTRLSMWHPEPARLIAKLPPLEQIDLPPAQLQHIELVRLVAAGAPFTEEHRDAFAAAAAGSGRHVALVNQSAAEVSGFAGARAEALRFVLAAVDAGLLDLTWLDRCPPLEALRGDLRFVAARGEVLDRLAGALQALGGR